MGTLLRIFRRPDYQSDVTQFIEQLKKDRPELESQQRAGRALLWDKAPIDLDNTRALQEARVAPKPYAYGDDPRKHG